MATKVIRLDTGTWDGSVHPAAHEKLHKTIRTLQSALKASAEKKITYTTWNVVTEKSSSLGPQGACYAQLPWATKDYLFLPLCPRYSGYGDEETYNFIRDTFYDGVILNPDGPFKTILEGTDVIRVSSALKSDIIYAPNDEPEETIVGIIIDPVAITKLVGPLGLKFFCYAFRFCWEVGAWSGTYSWFQGGSTNAQQVYRGLVEAGLHPIRAWLTSAYNASGARHGGHSPMMGNPSAGWVSNFLNSRFIPTATGIASNGCFQSDHDNFVPKDLHVPKADVPTISYTSMTDLMTRVSKAATSWGTLAVLMNEALDEALDMPVVEPDPEAPKMPTIKAGDHVKFIRVVTEKHGGFVGGSAIGALTAKYIKQGRVYQVAGVSTSGVQLIDPFGECADYYYFSPWSFEVTKEPASMPPPPPGFEWLTSQPAEAIFARKNSAFGWEARFDKLVGTKVKLRSVEIPNGRPFSAQVNKIEWNFPINCFDPVPADGPVKAPRKPRTKKAAA